MSAAGESSSIHAKLMREMGSRSGEWDPIPPQQYEALMDVRESEEIRILGALLKRTIGRANDGTRSAFAREHSGRPTRDVDLAHELGMSAANLSCAMQRLAEQGKISREAKPTRTYLCANAPPPDLGITEEGTEANKERTKVFCSENYSAEKLEFLSKLQERDPAQFRVAMARVVAIEFWGAQVKTDALQWARDREAEQREQVFMEIGYTKQDQRGRTREKKHPNPEAFQVPLKYEDFFVQNTVRIENVAAQLSVQEGKLILHSEPKNSVQTAHPYGPEVQSSEVQLALSKGSQGTRPETREAELKTEAARTEIKHEITARLQAARLTTMGAIRVDAGTITTLANHLLRLNTAGAIREVLDVLEERAREIKSGKRAADGWGYLVNAVRGEVDKRLPSGLREQVRAAAAAKSMKAGGGA